MEISFEEYVKAREADPDFYRDGASLEYGKVLVCGFYAMS